MRMIGALAFARRSGKPRVTDDAAWPIAIGYSTGFLSVVGQM